jgi:pimeloyl-ACP methyl ester carboxylesterase
MYRLTGRAKAFAGLLLLLVGFSGVLSAQLPIPAPAPGGPPNVFFGGVNPLAAANSPVILFVHGLGSNASYWFTNSNQMYGDAFAAGYRTAFVSMSVDNQDNHATIAANAAMLQSVMPFILTYFNTTQVYIVAHSKGGLDAQVAMEDPGFRSHVRAFFGLATPNQGTALADWAFGPGLKIANEFGLLSEGLYDLRPEFVAPLRSQLDPIFQTAGIPFYYMEGHADIFTKTSIFFITGPILANLTDGAENDGLVAVPEVTLPDSYSENLGVVAAEHTQVAFGQNTWTNIYGRITGLENRLSGWQEIASGGFGNDANTWIWSQTWWNGNLYVGTATNINCAIDYTEGIETGLPLYPPPGINCPTDPTQLPQPAEIWRYTPNTKTWARVYQSPVDIPIGNDAAGNPAYAARAIGLRGMTVYTESDGTQALYVGGVSAIADFALLPQYSAPNPPYPPPVLLRSTDGVNFTQVPQDPGTFMGNLVSGNTDILVASIRSLVSANGQMFAAVTDFRGEGFLIASNNPSAGDNAWVRVSPAPAIPNFAVWILANFNNALYIGTGDRTNDLGYGVYKTTDTWGSPTPYQFTPIILDGGWQPNQDLRSPTALTMHVWTPPVSFGGDGNPHLVVGTDRKIEMVQVNIDDSWDLLVGQPRSTPDGWKAPLSGIGYYFDNDFDGHFWQIQDETWNVQPGQNTESLGLHASTWDWSILLRTIGIANEAVAGEEGFDFFSSPDAQHWYIVSKDGMGDGYNMGGRSGVFSHFGLFWGTARVAGGTQEWQDTSMLDLNGDGIISQADINLVQQVMGTTVTGFDPRDVNGNGVIDAQDVQFLQSQCTFAACSDVPPPGYGYFQPGVQFQGFLSAQTEQQAGLNAVLTWPNQPNAVRYHVYRYTTYPNLTVLQQGGTGIQVSQALTINIPQDLANGTLSAACPYPGDSGLGLMWYCMLQDAYNASQAQPATTGLTYVGFPGPLLEIAQVAQSGNPGYTEAMPTTVQSLYFVRYEDANGNLSQPSNVVGAPSFNQQVPLY